MTLSLPNSITAKQLRDELHSVFNLGLPQGSSARKIAEQAAGPGQSYLRGKDAFGRAFQLLLALPDSNDSGQLRVKSNKGRTQAGSIVVEWQKAMADRATLFDEIGANGPTIFVVQVNGVDSAALWQEDQNKDPRVVKGGPGASLAFFETAPGLQADNIPDAAHGLFQTFEGTQY